MDYQEYKYECRERWCGVALMDALYNWRQWQGMREYLKNAMELFLDNPWQEDIDHKCHNETGTLTGFLWNCQRVFHPKGGCLDPFLNFEEHFQKIFLRRGLVIYCKGIIEEIESKRIEPDNQLKLEL